MDRLLAADQDSLEGFLEHLHEYQSAAAADRSAAAEDRRAAAEDRRAAARDRELASWARQQAAVEAAEATPAQESSRAPAQPVPPPVPSQPSLDVQLGSALRAATARQSDALESARHAAQLAVMIAETEGGIAESMRDLDAFGDEQAKARRLELAEAATRGAEVATARGERLRALAERAAGNLELATLRSVLVRAATAFAELAHAERTIAGALDVLAAHEHPERADPLRREAEEARAAADRADARASELHHQELATYRGASSTQEQGSSA